MARPVTPTYQSMLQLCGLDTDDALYTTLTTGNTALDVTNTQLGRMFGDLHDAERALANHLLRLGTATATMAERTSAGMSPDPTWVKTHVAAVDQASTQLLDAVGAIKVLAPIRKALLAS
jgi:hypothetical protein